MRAYERLLNYVKVYTTSDPNSGTHPSTMRQFDLARQLVDELKALGLADAHVDEHCYVYATLPATPRSTKTTTAARSYCPPPAPCWTRRFSRF